jgi:hypothetical protein
MVAQLVEALHYEPNGRGFDFRWCHWHQLSGHTISLGSTQPQTEMYTRYTFLGVKEVGAEGWRPCHLHVPIVRISGSFILLEPSWRAPPCTGIALHVTWVTPIISNANSYCRYSRVIMIKLMLLLSILIKTKFKFPVYSTSHEWNCNRLIN